MSEAFENIYRDYLKEISEVDLDRVKDRLGITTDNGEAVIPFFGIPYRVSGEGVSDLKGLRPSHSVSVVLFKYLLMCPDDPPGESEWITYKDFKDALPFAGGFLNNAEKPIGGTFSGRLADLQQAGAKLSGHRVETEVRSDLVLWFDALPKVPLLLLFNDRDEDFPAQCTLLFERRAENYLDMECLAIVGWALAEWLKKIANPS